MVYDSGKVIEAADYNQLVSDINKIFGTGVGDFGYGGDSIDVPARINLAEVAVGEVLDNQNWLDLRNAIADCADQQGTILPDGLPSVTDIEDGDIAAFFPRLASPSNLFAITENRFNVNPVFSPTITTPPADRFPSVRTISWGSLIQHEFVITFENSDHARTFFNLGGTMRVSALRTGGSPSVKNGAWDAILESNGLFTIDRLVYYSLTSSLEDLRSQASPLEGSIYSAFGAYSASSIWTISGKRDDDQGLNGGNGSEIRIVSSFLDGNSNIPDEVDGTFTSSVDEYKFDYDNGTGDGAFNIESPTYRTIQGVDDGS